MYEASLNYTIGIYFFYGSKDSYSSIACTRQNLVSHCISQKSKISTNILLLLSISDTEPDNLFSLVRIVYEQYLSFVSFAGKPVPIYHNMIYIIENLINASNSILIETMLNGLSYSVFLSVLLIGKLAGGISLCDIFLEYRPVSRDFRLVLLLPFNKTMKAIIAFKLL